MRTDQKTKTSLPSKTLSIFLFCLCITISANASEISGVSFQASYKEEGVNLSLQGTGLKTKFFIKAFVAGFYKNNLENEDILGEVSKRVEVEYFVNISGKKLNNFTIDTMKKNITEEEYSQILNEVDLMCQYFVDLKPGDRFSLTYIPGIGTKFEHNKKLRGVIKGSDFGKALFSVWVGEKPFDENLKNKILGSDNKVNFYNEKLVLQPKGKGEKRNDNIVVR
jgi:hypothetical protein